MAGESTKAMPAYCLRCKTFRKAGHTHPKDAPAERGSDIYRDDDFDLLTDCRDTDELRRIVGH